MYEIFEIFQVKIAKNGLQVMSGRPDERYAHTRRACTENLFKQSCKAEKGRQNPLFLPRELAEREKEEGGSDN